MQTVQEIQLNAAIWKEEDTYVAYNLQLDISSCGGTPEEAKQNLADAVTAFIEEARSMGTLQQIHHRRLACIFERDGFVYSRTAGDHDVYTKAGCIRPLVIPRYRAACLSRERYFELLERCP